MTFNQALNEALNAVATLDDLRAFLKERDILFLDQDDALLINDGDPWGSEPGEDVPPTRGVPKPTVDDDELPLADVFDRGGVQVTVDDFGRVQWRSEDFHASFPDLESFWNQFLNFIEKGRDFDVLDGTTPIGAP